MKKGAGGLRPFLNLLFPIFFFIIATELNGFFTNYYTPTGVSWISSVKY